MKRFLIQLLLFLIPAIVLLVININFMSFFYFRPWEDISFKYQDVYSLSPFYPDSKIFRNSVGDLCHHTNNAVYKHEYWITDKLGFRNDEFVDKPDILFIGDSFIVGSSLSQKDILSNKVKSKFDNTIKVYNMAPSNFSQFDYYLRLGIIKKPKILIYSQVERKLPQPMYTIKFGLLHNVVLKLFNTMNVNVYIDKMLKFSSINWIKARIQNNKGIGVRGISNMYFLNGYSQKYEDNYVNKSLEIINTYKKYCDSLGIKFIYLAMPNKETVYFDLVPFVKQPNYLLQLDSLLKTEKIATINTLKIYNDFRKKNKILLYHLDDTHWTPIATELISKEIVRILKQNKQN